MQNFDHPVDELAHVAKLLAEEKKHDYELYEKSMKTTSLSQRSKEGITWYPLRVKERGFGLGSYPFLLLQRNAGDKRGHHFHVGSPVALFQEGSNESLLGTVAGLGPDVIKVTFYKDELPDWTHDGKLGINLLFDTRTYDVMEQALRNTVNIEKGPLKQLRDTLLGFREAVVEPIDYSSEKLNESQKKAVAQILGTQDIALVHGPPGTGKTTTLVAAAKALCARKEQLLVCAPSNAAVDHLAQQMHLAGLDVVRIGNVARVDAEVVSLTLESLIANDKGAKLIKDLKRKANEYRNLAHKYKRNFGKAERDQRKALFKEARDLMDEARAMEDHLVERFLDKAQVICCTLIGSAHGYLGDRRFSTALIDEAAQALEAATWVPIQRVDKVVLAGDPFQLPPTIKKESLSKQGLGTTLLEKAMERSSASTLLKTQYRMNAQIMHFSNQYFYDEALEAGSTVKDWLLSPDIPAMEFVDTAGTGYEEKQDEKSSSRYNPEEAALLKRHLDTLLEKKLSMTVGIISPYKAQVNWMHEVWKDHKQVSVQTIDSFQGQERDCIYISLVRSNERQEIGFLKDYRRMNVAMTRAKKRLVIIGDSATIGGDPFYEKLLEYIDQQGFYHTAWEWMQ